MTRTPKSLDEKYTGVEPVWTGWETWPLDKFFSEVNRAFYYYNYFNSGKDLKPKVLAWMKTEGYSRDDIAAVRKSRDIDCGITLGTIAVSLSRGMPSYHPRTEEWLATKPARTGVKDHKEWLKGRVAQLIVLGNSATPDPTEEDEAAPKAVVKAPPMTIQERIRASANEAAEEIDEWLDGFITDPKNFDPAGLDFAGLFARRKITQAHARVLRAMYAGQFAQAEELVGPKLKNNDMYDQLVEGYARYTKAEQKKMHEALRNLIGACDMLIGAAKANRVVRAKKAPSKEKLIAKLKYAATDARYKLASVNPLDVIGATELWVFNTKTRKLGRYVADTHTTFSFKGSRLTGYDEASSVQRTVRKPEEKLPEFKAAGKVALRTFLNGINATETKLTGLINPDTVLLKVSK